MVSPQTPGLVAARAVQTVAKDAAGARWFGSGYLVAADLVLSVQHVLHGADRPSVRFVDGPGQFREVGAQVVFADAAADVAVLRLDDPEQQVPPVVFGHLATPAACETVGFPRFKLNDDHRAARAAGLAPGSRRAYRDSEHVSGSCTPDSNRYSGTLALIVPAPGRDPDPGSSPWEGMSGAAVFTGGQLIGLVAEHHRREGLGRLTATAVHRWPHLVDAGSWRRLQDLLGIPDSQASPSPLQPRHLQPAAALVPSATPTNLQDLARLAERAEQAALAVTNTHRAQSLAAVAKVVAGSDPAHAERIAQAISSEGSRTTALADVVRASTGNPGEAERIALNIPGGWQRAQALIAVVPLVAVSDPARAAELADQAINEALATTDNDELRASLLLRVVEALAASNPPHAEHIALTIADGSSYRVSALLAVAKAIARSDPDYAARLADKAENAALHVWGASYRSYCLLAVAKVVADSDPIQAARLITEAERNALDTTDASRAERLFAVAGAIVSSDSSRAARLVDEARRAVGAIADMQSRIQTLLDGLKAAVGDPASAGPVADQAISGARTIKDAYDQAYALSKIAEVIAGSDPDRAKRAALAITGLESRAETLAAAATVVAAVDPVRAAHLADQAEHAALAITDERARGRALSGIVSALAASDQPRAERIALAITDDFHKAHALAAVAQAIAADPARAGRLADQAEHAALALADGGSRGSALLAVIKATASSDLSRAMRAVGQAERAALAIADDKVQAKALLALVGVVAALDPARAAHLADQAEHAALAIADHTAQMDVLLALVGVVAALDPARAAHLADQAEHAALAIVDEASRAAALTKTLLARRNTGC